MRLFDAHNHLQDDRFGGRQDELMADCAAVGLCRMVVNGTRESDWPTVATLAKRHDCVMPSFGLHPWFILDRSTEWVAKLEQQLDAWPSAVGEIGLDRWKPGLDYDGQEAVFTTQLRQAADRNLPASIHCLKSWGRLHELLRAGPLPRRGFLLHSYGGPAEMVEPLAKLGAYFSFPGAFTHERKTRQRDAFRRVPADRLLIETDAPDQPLPEDRVNHPLRQAVNHPANIAAVYEAAAETLDQSAGDLAKCVEENFVRLFGD
ncbi:MAG: TatD family hydrolase [Verrucomicrobiota bacterium]|jgi:TatD DNase family protein|nr:TatD family hydrolase [Verrucomicrobiota bacterium]MDP7048507.1 TatD family hydrolase [Verrucomicrobiota bacterium]